ncbi:hypothetical protein [Sphingomonas oligophenolica]|uniref:Uncharacterized protein n=1 Tax=Sphingomonas oligophenolica TaxID=301154 RepID=A0A502CDT3_9SPHN|nr:hypothetical protein [Sphingomonas oligophenolica]TPG09946.1 hypothetical protein EAH84_13250 [Sphingomonas oligophenolica]
MFHRHPVLTAMTLTLGLATAGCNRESSTTNLASGDAIAVATHTNRIEPGPSASAPVPKPAGEPQHSTSPQLAKLAPRLAVDGEGLRLFDPTTTSASPIPFGRPQAAVIAAIERFRGPSDQGVNQDCGAGPVDYASWSDGLSLVFQQHRFVGWGLDHRAAGTIATASGIGPGSTRAELESTYANVDVNRTSLGNEFTAGGFSGVIDGSTAASKITDMWAGTNCAAR